MSFCDVFIIVLEIIVFTFVGFFANKFTRLIIKNESITNSKQRLSNTNEFLKTFFISTLIVTLPFFILFCVNKYVPGAQASANKTVNPIVGKIVAVTLLVAFFVFIVWAVWLFAHILFSKPKTNSPGKSKVKPIKIARRKR